MLANVLAEFDGQATINISLASRELGFGYKRRAAGVRLSQPNHCEPACTQPGLTYFTSIGMFSPYHFFRDYLDLMLGTLYAHGIAVRENDEELGRQLWVPFEVTERANPEAHSPQLSPA